MRYHVEGHTEYDEDAISNISGQYPPFRVFDKDLHGYTGPGFDIREQAEELAAALNAPYQGSQNIPTSTVKYAATVTLLFDVKDSGCGETNELRASEAVAKLLTDYAEPEGFINDWGFVFFSGSHMLPCRVALPSDDSYQSVKDLIYIRETK